MKIDNKKDKKIFDKKAYDIEYQKKNLKRIPLNIQLEMFEKWKKTAEIAGMPLNTFIKSAVNEKIENFEKSVDSHDDESGKVLSDSLSD